MHPNSVGVAHKGRFVSCYSIIFFQSNLLIGYLRAPFPYRSSWFRYTLFVNNVVIRTHAVQRTFMDVHRVSLEPKLDLRLLCAVPAHHRAHRSRSRTEFYFENSSELQVSQVESY